jgi:hypothetical protein
MINSHDQNYKVGDQVNITNVPRYINELAIVLKVHENEGFYSRCLIEYQSPNLYTVEGRKSQSWVSAKNLRYDIMYIRDKKLEMVLESVTGSH